jgi:hypothetical protein
VTDVGFSDVPLFAFDASAAAITPDDIKAVAIAHNKAVSIQPWTNPLHFPKPIDFDIGLVICLSATGETVAGNFPFLATVVFE